MTGHRQFIRIALATAIVLPVTAMLMAKTSTSVFATSASATQNVTATVSAGTVNVTAPAALALGTVAPGASLTAQALGTVTWTATTGVAGTLSVAVRDLCNQAGWVSGTACPAANTIAYTGITMHSGGTMAAASDGSCVSSNNTGSTPTSTVTNSAFAGTDTTAGTTYSTAKNIASQLSSAAGCWSQAGNNVDINIPAGTASGALTNSAQIQYTITA